MIFLDKLNKPKAILLPKKADDSDEMKQSKIKYSERNNKCQSDIFLFLSTFFLLFLFVVAAFFTKLQETNEIPGTLPPPRTRRRRAQLRHPDGERQRRHPPVQFPRLREEVTIPTASVGRGPRQPRKGEHWHRSDISEGARCGGPAA